jgi:rod shape-determining protein MreD
MREFPYAIYLFDLSIPYLIYLSLFLPLKVSLPFVLLLGYFMDSLSGGPFGLYLSIYFWLAVAFRQITDFLQINSIAIIPFAVGLAVFLEDLLLMIAVSSMKTQHGVDPSSVQMIGWHLMLAMLMGPLVFLMIQWIHSRRDLQVADGSTSETRRLLWPTT